jgi:hypothetical protein
VSITAPAYALVDPHVCKIQHGVNDGTWAAGQCTSTVAQLSAQDAANVLDSSSTLADEAVTQDVEYDKYASYEFESCKIDSPVDSVSVYTTSCKPPHLLLGKDSDDGNPPTAPMDDLALVEDILHSQSEGSSSLVHFVVPSNDQDITSVHGESEDDSPAKLAHTTKQTPCPHCNVPTITESNDTWSDKPREANVNDFVHDEVITHDFVEYSPNPNAYDNWGALIERGVNGGTERDDISVIAKSNCCVDIQVVDNHHMNDVSIVTTEEVINIQKRPSVATLQQYAHNDKRKTVHSCEELHAFKQAAHDKSTKVGEKDDWIIEMEQLSSLSFHPLFDYEYGDYGHAYVVCEGILSDSIMKNSTIIDYKSQDQYNWFHIYGNVEELLVTVASKSFAKPCVLPHCYDDSNLYHDTVMGRAVTGIVYMTIEISIDWFSKKQSRVETIPYGSEFVAELTCVEQTIDLPKTLKYDGVPALEGIHVWRSQHKSC